VKIRTRSKDIWKIKFFWDNAKNVKNDAYILKTYFFGFSLFFVIFGFLKKFIKKMGQKLSSNRCPLFTMLTKQNSSMFCIVSFVKKKKGKWSHYLGRPAPFEEKWSIFRGDQLTHSYWSILWVTCPSGKKEEWSHCNGWPTQVEEWPYCNGWPI